MIVIETFERTRLYQPAPRRVDRFEPVCRHCFHDSQHETYCCQCQPVKHRLRRMRPTLDDLIEAHYR